jgi:hypothetical protein
VSSLLISKSSVFSPSPSSCCCCSASPNELNK